MSCGNGVPSTSHHGFSRKRSFGQQVPHSAPGWVTCRRQPPRRKQQPRGPFRHPTDRALDPIDRNRQVSCHRPPRIAEQVGRKRHPSPVENPPGRKSRSKNSRSKIPRPRAADLRYRPPDRQQAACDLAQRARRRFPDGARRRRFGTAPVDGRPRLRGRGSCFASHRRRATPFLPAARQIRPCGWRLMRRSSAQAMAPLPLPACCRFHRGDLVSSWCPCCRCRMRTTYRACWCRSAAHSAGGLFLAAMAGAGTLAELRESLLDAETDIYGGASLASRH